jgi:hypothetical protein
MKELTSRSIVSLLSVPRQTLPVKVSITFVVHVSEERAVEGKVI